MMKRFTLILLLMFISSPALADTKISELTEDTTPTTDDLVVTVNDPAGTPASRKVTIGNLLREPNIPSTITRDAEWDTIGEIETVTGVNIILNTEIDTFNELNSIVADQTLIHSNSNIATATSLSANGANCAAGSLAAGVDASGAAEGCTDVWTEAENTAAGYISNVVEDTTPQLGGELDAQGNNIIDLGDVTFQTGAAGGTLRTGTSSADKFTLQAYDVNGAAYTTLLQADAGNDPVLQVLVDTFQFEDRTDTTKELHLQLSGSATGTDTTLATSSTVARTITFPDATDTLVGKATTDTLTNKTINTASNTITVVEADISDLSHTTDTGPAPDCVGTTTYQDGEGNCDDISSVYQAADADLTDLADGSLTGTKVGFADTNSDFTATDVQSAIEELVSSNGSGPNAADGKVEWSQLVGVPAGFADGSDDGAGGSAGTMNTVKEAGTQVGGSDIVTLDFGAGFDVAESPDTEANLSIDLSELNLTDFSEVNSATATAGRLFIADGTDFDSVAMSGDATLASDGTLTIANNAVALTTDTTGDYVSSITAGTGLTSTGATTGEGISHSLSVDLGTSIESSEITDDEVAFGDIDYSATLAGNPALGVDECYFTTTASGGGVICEGSTADTSEQLYLFPNVNTADSTDYVMVDNTQITGIDDTSIIVVGGTIEAALGTTIDATEIETNAVGVDELADINSVTKTEGRLFIADGTDFESMALQGDCTLDGAGFITCPSASGITGLTADSGGTTTGSTVTIAGGTNVTTSRSGDTITINSSAGGGGGATEVILPIYSAKITGSFVTDGDATQGAQIDAGDGNWRLLFDATTDEAAVWQFRMPNNYSSAPVLKVQYSMVSATANEVEFEGAIMCVSDGDAADVGTASFSTIAVGSATVPGTVGYPDEISITLTDDSCAAGDAVWVYLSTDSDDATNDDATGDREVINASLSYTGS